MAYGLHWEWRGFGEPSANIRAQVEALKPLRQGTAELVDRYLWLPGCDINVKLRFLYGSESLKFKRMVEKDDRLELQLWMEKAEEDYVFPLERKAVEELSRAVGVDLPTEEDIANIEELVRLLRASTDVVQIVTVRKTRRSYVWTSDDMAALVDLGDISSPEQTVTIGIEDLAGLNEFSSREKVIAARDTVAIARADMSLPGELETSSYLQMLTSWVGKQRG